MGSVVIINNKPYKFNNFEKRNNGKAWDKCWNCF
ncbi:phage-like protein [Staphylococcus aureus]|uniref:77ORF178 n=1 Tax=Biseptimavirus bv77 TaxID=259901 RepID=Q6R833_9CAUD|nr:77ORF178 [Staphylococcus phage 77]EUJ99339.1 hypothetical protein U095_02823 [Staphylococcus aureus DAR5866]EUK12172.1 hypothetical protein U097_00945 [Staphylococcus aureus DAR5844]EYO86209.1 hypothetical protein W201_02687 [Staphylococcus aureus DAR5877]EYR56160.1 hypothetical protein W309_02885 [Staphylococcus aureus DAR5868]CAC6072144.1 phage-like protein [Staphylococcus aureus]